jgi:phosphate starvation-inducible PhoH-like protein
MAKNHKLLPDEPVSAEGNFTSEDQGYLLALCGPTDDFLHLLEKECDAKILRRGASFRIEAKDESSLALLKEVLRRMEQRINAGLKLDEVVIRAMLAKPAVAEESAANLTIRTPRLSIQAMTPTQAAYLDNIRTHTLTFATGPAGTGKSFLAVAVAVQELLAHRVDKLVFVRPLIEAGERMGFLPGGVEEKVDPYLRPLFDALHAMVGFELTERWREQKLLELAPLAFMRGRTLSRAFVILDEAQNTTIDQMKMFLTRMGADSRVVVTGDLTQIDLPPNTTSGLKHALSILSPDEDIAMCEFTKADVMRHRLVQRIVAAYEKSERTQGDDFDAE